MVSIEEGSGVTVCVFWACARYIQVVCVCVCVCVCEVEGYCTEAVGLILLCAPVGSESRFLFFKGPLREKRLPGAEPAVTVSDTDRETTKSE